MTDRRQDDDNVVRKVLKNEVTWIISVLVFGWGIVTQVILPINTIQLQLVSIQAQLSTFQGYDARITKVSNDVIRLIADDNNFKR